MKTFLYTFLFTNNKVTYSLLCTSITFIASLFCIKLCCQLLNIQNNAKKNIIASILLSSSIIIGKMIVAAPYYRIYSILVYPTIIFFIYKVSITKSILSDVIMFLVVVIIDTAFSLLYYNLFDIEDLKTGITIPAFKIALIFTMTMIYIISYFVVKKLGIQINISKNISESELRRIVFLSLVGLYVLTIQLWEAVYFSSQLSPILILSNIIAILLYFYLSMSNIIKIINIEKSNIHIKALKEHNQTLKNMNNDVRTFKHDFNNIIQAIGGYIATNDMTGLTKYYNEISKDCTNLNKLEILNPSTINEPAIYNLMTSKVYLAQQDGIETNLYISIDLSSLNVNIYEITRILGILLDNAIEAAKECNEKLINVEFKANPSNNMKLIKIENTYKEKNVDLDKIFKKSYSSKPGNSGLGLWEVRKILNRNNNLNLFTTKNALFFTQQLEIFEL